MSPERDRTGSSWLRYSHLGIQFSVTVVAFVLLGTWADGRLGTDPWLTIALSLGGMAAATYLLIRQVARIPR